MQKSLLGILLIFVFPFSLWGQGPTFDPGRTTVLVFSSNVYGEVGPCG